MSGYVITSPNGRVSLTVELMGGKLSYSAQKDGVSIVDRSPLGLRLRQCDLTQGLTLLHEHYASVDETYQIPAFKKKTCVNHANTLSLMLEKHEETLKTPYTPESFAGYSYTIAQNQSAMQIFSRELNKWRKL